MTSSIFQAGGVSQIIAGTGVTLSPSNGKGIVTINSSGTTGAVTSFKGRTGAVVPFNGDYTVAQVMGAAPLDSPAFTGTPTVPTQAFGDSTTKAASTAFVQYAVTASISGVASFNARSGSVTLLNIDITGALGYTPANVVGASLTGVPTAPTASYGTNTTQLATTQFVQSAVSGSVAGVASFKSWSGGSPRTGAVTLVDTDVASALTSAPTNNWIWNSDIPGAVDAGVGKSIYIQRHATYSEAAAAGGGVTGALYVHSFTPANAHNTYEWGITSEMFSYSTGHPDTVTPANGVAPQNVAMNGTIWKRSSAPVWAGNFNAQNQFNNLSYPSAGYATVACEIDVGGFGTDTGAQTIAVHCAGNLSDAPDWQASTGYVTGRFVKPTTGGSYYYSNNGGSGTSGGTQPTWPTTVGATVIDGTVTWTCAAKAVSLYSGTLVSGGWQYGHRVFSDGGSVASFYSEATGTYAAQLKGTYAVGLELSEATNITGVAIRLRSGDSIAFDGTNQYKMRLNAGSGILEFYNGTTRHGYINIGSGADVNFNAAAAGGVSSFNGATGAVSFGYTEIVSALGYTPANASAGMVDTTTAQSVGGVKTFTSMPTFASGIVSQSNILISSGNTVAWASGGGNVDFGTGKTNAFYLRIVVDGAPYWIQCLNP